MMHSLTPMFVLFVLIPSLALAYPRVVQPITVKRLPHRGRSNNFVLEARGKNIATHFETGQGACGGFNVDSDFIVALNSGQYGNGENCYKMITINCNGKTTQAQIVDECPGCSYGGIDMSNGLFSYFAPLGDGILFVDWHFTDDSPKPETKKPEPTPGPTTTTHKHKTTTTTTTTTTTSSSATKTTTSSTSEAQTKSSTSTYSTASLTTTSEVPAATPTYTSVHNISNLKALVVGLGQLVLSENS